MAKEYGNIRYIGTIGGIRHYPMEGTEGIVAATKGIVPKTILDHSPVFAGSRRSRFEFAGKSKLAKEIRGALGLWSLTIVNRHLHPKMVSLMHDIAKMDKESPDGKRNIYLSRYKEMLYQLESYHYYKPFAEIMRCLYIVEDTGERNTVKLVLKGLYPKMHIKAPAKASHFQLYLSIGSVNDCIYNAEFNFYESYKSGSHCYVNYTNTDWIPIDGALMDDLTLAISLPETHVLTESETVLRSFGIVFGQMTSQVEPLKRDRGSITFLGAV